MSFSALPIRRVFKVVNGGTPTADEANWNGRIPWATPADFGAQFSHLSATRRSLTPVGAATGSTVAPSGSILVSTRAPIGYVALAREDMAFNQGCRALVPRIPCDPRFFGYQLEARADSIRAEGLGTTFAELSSEKLASFPVSVPPPHEQRRIADFLDAETTRIDALVRAYDRVKSLASERAQTMIDAEIDREPLDTPLRYIIRFREGPGIMAVDFHQEGVPLIRISGLQEGKVTLRGCNFLDPEKVARQWQHFRLQLGDRLISGSATMGSVSLVDDPEVVGSIPYTGLMILRPARSGVEMDYVEAFLKSSRFLRQIDTLKTGAAMQHFGPTHLSQVYASLPSVEKQRRVVDKVAEALSFSEQVARLTNRQVTLLAERRRALITAAVTGQFDVSTAGGRNVTDGVPTV